MSGLLELIKSRRNPLEESWNECLEMLHATEEMVRLARSCRHAGQEARGRLRRLHKMDSEVNRQQERIRRRVFAHLAIAPSRDVSTSLKTLSIAIHLERVGDYAKNVAEVYLLLRGSEAFGSSQVETLSSLDAEIVRIFAATREALVTTEAEAAREVAELARGVSATCRREIEGAICAEGDPGYESSSLAYVLLLRHDKRIASHLKNAANVVVNPIHKLR